MTPVFGIKNRAGQWLHIRRFDAEGKVLLTPRQTEAWVSFKEQAVAQASFLEPPEDYVVVELPAFDLLTLVAIDELAQSMGVRASFHGHHHVSITYSEHTERLGFRAYGVGFCGVMNHDGKIIRPGDLDEARRYRATHPKGQ